MKIPKAFWLIICLSLISGCSGKSTPNEEKITITIEKPSQTAQKEKENAHDVSKSVSVSPEHKQKEKKPGSKTLRKPVAPTPSRLSKPAPQRSFNKPVQKNKLAKKMDFRSVAQRLNIDMHSKSEIVGYWKSIVGKSVTWGGVVYRVKAGRSRFKMLINNTRVESTKGFNVVLIGDRDNKVQNDITRGKIVRFTGKLAKYKRGSNRSSAIIVLRDAKILGTIR